VIAIEGRRDCYGERCLVRILDEHRDPGDGLESEPLPTHSEAKREHENCAQTRSKHPAIWLRSGWRSNAFWG
jgi:hypothetical protein